MVDANAGKKNQLYYGDNLDVLRKIDDETVDLCYIDPPFNSKRNYNQIYNRIGKEDRAQAQAFMDTWTWDDQANAGLTEILSNERGKTPSHAVDLIKGLTPVLGKDSLLAYLIAMTLRIVEIHRVLKGTGSFYLHCDPTASHYLKIVLDAVFVAQGGEYQNEIIWKRTSSHNRAKRWGPVHDVILYYTKSDNPTWNRVVQELDPAYKDAFYRQSDERGQYRSSDLTGPGTRTGDSGMSWSSVDPTTKGRHWEPPPDRALPDWFVRPEGYPKLSVRERLSVLDSQGLILWPKKAGGTPSFKRYLTDDSGAAIQDVITDIQPLSAQDAEKLGYPTQKPEALLKRIIETSTNEGDLILDAFCGCGTTIAVAERMNRRWIGIDITYQAIAVILKRISDTFGKDRLETITLGGVPRDMRAAVALANKKDDRLRKEFEKWAILTYTNNRAIVNDKKGADGGVDGVAYTQTGKTDNAKIVFQVKSGSVSRGDIAKLRGDMQREDAVVGILITLQPPTGPMVEEAKGSGRWKHPLFVNSFDCVKIVTIQDMLENNARFDMPLPVQVLKSAPRTQKTEQTDLPI